jgi:hypothetical protein
MQEAAEDLPRAAAAAAAAETAALAKPRYGSNEAINPASLIFDPHWYLTQYPDVAAAGLDPVQHFLKSGFAEGRNPNPYFDSSWYVAAYPDVAGHVAEHGENPFMHYLFYGVREGRKPNGNPG